MEPAERVGRLDRVVPPVQAALLALRGLREQAERQALRVHQVPVEQLVPSERVERVERVERQGPQVLNARQARVEQVM